MLLQGALPAARMGTLRDPVHSLTQVVRQSALSYLSDRSVPANLGTPHPVYIKSWLPLSSTTTIIYCFWSRSRATITWPIIALPVWFFMSSVHFYCSELARSSNYFSLTGSKLEAMSPFVLKYEILLVLFSPLRTKYYFFLLLLVPKIGRQILLAHYNMWLL